MLQTVETLVKGKFDEVQNRLDERAPAALREGEHAILLSAASGEPGTARPTLVDHLLSGQAWDDETVEAVTARAKTPSRKR